MTNYIERDRRYKHFAGLVPATGYKTDFKFPWSPVLNPIHNNYLAIHRAILELACAGCDSIWVSCYDHEINVLKQVVGDSVRDPALINLPFKKRKNWYERLIPIYYVPLRLIDKERRDTVSFSIKRVAQESYFICRYLSKYVKPKIFMVSFPFGVSNPFLMLNYRRLLRRQIYIFKHQGKSVITNDYIPFVFTSKQYKQFSQNYWSKQTYQYGGDSYGNLQRLPSEERYYSKKITMTDTWAFLEDLNHLTVELDSWYDISSWSGLEDWYSSKSSHYFDLPLKYNYFRKNKWQEIASGDFKFDLT